jgi:aminoglycoside phosphotransferase (APT) family kinase protein
MDRAPGSWSPVSAPWAFEYLDGLGLLDQRLHRQVHSRSGRNRVLIVRRSSGEGELVLKQFAITEEPTAWFRREERFLRENARLAIPTPVVVDDAWQVLILPWGGQPMWDLLGREPVDRYGGKLRTVLSQIHSCPNSSPRTPAIVAWLTSDLPYRGRGAAQQRLFAALRRDGIAAEVAWDRRSEWRDGSARRLTHGDLKLEHVLVNPEGKITIIDWETACGGPAEWDQACFVRSLMVHAVRGYSGWGDGHSRLVTALLSNSEIAALRFRQMLALALWQAALEWEVGHTALSRQAGAIAQLGYTVLRAPERLSALLSVAR